MSHGDRFTEVQLNKRFFLEQANELGIHKYICIYLYRHISTYLYADCVPLKLRGTGEKSEKEGEKKK